MNPSCDERGLLALLGSMTGDAAALGLHWLYDTDRLAAVAGDTVAFREPNQADFEGFTGYFAHGARRSGDLSHYGESALVMLRSLAACGGGFNVCHYQRTFRQHFGAGGAFVGYLDNATRITLENLARVEREATAAAMAAASGLPEALRGKLVAQVIPYNRLYSGDALLGPVERDVRMTGGDEATVRVAWEIVRAVDRVAEQLTGADDDQVSATAKLPALVAGGLHRHPPSSPEFCQAVEAAVRATNNNDEAVRYSQACAVLLHGAVEGLDVEESVRAAIAAAHPDVRRRLQWAANAPPSADPVSFVKSLGQTCYVSEAIPAVFYLLTRFRSYPDALNWNIRAGGDSCGRGLVLGAVLGAMFGVGGEKGIPFAWLLNLRSAKLVVDLYQRCL